MFGIGKGPPTGFASAGTATSVGRVSDVGGLVLVVEDEAPIADVHRRYLTSEGFGVHVESDGELALQAAARLRPVAIVLDVGLPGRDGISVCRALRERGDWTPVLFVTARDDEIDRVLGLEIGGDDYLTKPFSPRELVARVKAVLRRSGAGPAPRTLTAGAVRLESDTRRVRVADLEVDLTPTEFRLLETLLAAGGRVVDRAELMASAWGQADYGGSRTVDVHVAQLRAKLGAGSPIETVRGVGYRVSAGTRP